MIKEIQIPLPAYGDFHYVNVKIEAGQPFSMVDALEAINDHKLLWEASKGQIGLANKDWNAAVDEYLKTGKLIAGTELYAQMSSKQQFFFQELKKANKRIKIDTD